MNRMIAIDSGKFATKAVMQKADGSERFLSFRTKLQETARTEVQGKSFIVEFGGKRYLLGEQAEVISSKTTKAEELHRIAAYTALAQLADTGDDIVVVIGCPLSVYENADSKKQYKEYMFPTRQIDIKVNVYYEGRGPEQLDLNHLSEPVYITSVINPEYVLKLDQNGYALLQNGETVLSLGKESPKFEEQLESMLCSMEEIVVLSKEEAELPPEKRVQLIEERAGIKENAASNQYALNYEERKERFLNMDFEVMSPEEQELIRRCFEHKTVISFVDHSFEERMNDRVLQEKILEHKKPEKGKEP